jgi:hypothetical protein
MSETGFSRMKETLDFSFRQRKNSLQGYEYVCLYPPALPALWYFLIVSSLTNNQVAEDEMGGPCSMNGEKRNAYRLLVGKPEGKRPIRIILYII